MTQEAAAPTSRPGDVRSRLEWVDVARGIAVVPVVFYHSVIALPVAGIEAPQWLESLNDGLAPYRMPVLVFLSGLFLSRALTKPLRSFVASKARTLLWPWLVWTLITVGILGAGSTLAGEHDFGLGSAVDVMLDQRTYTWYLWNLFAFFVLARLIPAVAHAWCVPALLVVSTILPGDQEWDRFAFLMAVFLAGSVSMTAMERSRRGQRPWLTAVGVVAAATMIGLAAAGVDLRYTLPSIIGVAGAAIVLRPWGTWLAGRAVGRLLARGGHHSLTVYVTHWPVVTVTINLVARTDLRDAALATAVMMAAGLGASAVAVVLRSRSRLVDRLYVLPAKR